MANLAKEILIASRPVHWIKNLSLFAAIVFTGTLQVPTYFLVVFWAFISFNLTASATYLINDIVDSPRDALHPIKKERPIAAGRLSKKHALLAALFFATVSVFIALSINTLFFYILLFYLALQIFYSLGLKNIPIIDIIVIASGFIVRVYAGALVINAHLSVWFLLCVISVALFLAAGKRRAELSITGSSETRKSLSKYKPELLNAYVTMFGNAAWMSWALFTFFESPPVDLKLWLFLAEISKATTISKLLMITIPVVIFIIMRYQALIFEDRSEAPEKVLLTDKPLVISIILYGIMVMAILYGGVVII